jgi:hypothetical protein
VPDALHAQPARPRPQAVARRYMSIDSIAKALDYPPTEPEEEITIEAAA